MSLRSICAGGQRITDVEGRDPRTDGGDDGAEENRSYEHGQNDAVC